jgi:tripartite-type tricarboxylate transporter receptor subunit TctC
METKMNGVEHSRRRLFGYAATLSALAVCRPSFAQDDTKFPDHAVRLLVAFPPGGATDLIARELSRALTAVWNQPIVVDNRPGAAGLIAAETTAKAAPDGYTLFLATDGAITAVPFLQEKMPYDALNDFVPVEMVAGIPLMLVANPDLKVKTLAEFVALAKSKPGAIDYASSGVGASHYMSMELFQRAAGIKLNHIPYKGGAPALQDVVAGRVSVMFSAISTALPFIKNGRLVPLATGSLERSPLMPELPTVAELGFPGFEAGNWVVILAPKGTTPELSARIRDGLEKVVHTAAYRNALEAQGNEARSSTSEEISKRIRTEYERNRILIKNAGINQGA